MIKKKFPTQTNETHLINISLFLKGKKQKLSKRRKSNTLFTIKLIYFRNKIKHI